MSAPVCTRPTAPPRDVPRWAEGPPRPPPPSPPTGDAPAAPVPSQVLSSRVADGGDGAQCGHAGPTTSRSSNPAPRNSSRRRSRPWPLLCTPSSRRCAPGAGAAAAGSETAVQHGGVRTMLEPRGGKRTDVGAGSAMAAATASRSPSRAWRTNCDTATWTEGSGGPASSLSTAMVHRWLRRGWYMVPASSGAAPVG